MVDVLKRRGMRRENRRRPLLYVATLFAVLFCLGGCARKPLPERHASEPDGANAVRVEARASSIRTVHLVVDAGESMLLGAVSEGRWLSPDSAAPLTREGAKYGLYTLTRRLGESRGGKATPPSQPCANPSVHIVNVPQVNADVIAISGDSNALPRTPSIQSTRQRPYRNLVARWLREHGIADPSVNITQLLRIDLEGDNTDEVLIAANLLRGAGASARRGDYSVVLLRKIIKGEVQTIPLLEEYYLADCAGNCAPAAHRIAALLDINGDGVMEVILAWRDYKGRGKTVYQVQGSDVRSVLSWACAP
jgi:hypothetical protein